MFYIIGSPIAAITTVLTTFLNNMSTGNMIILGIIQGCMLAFDMGGPFNKVAYAFALAAMDSGNFMPMAANFIGSMSPPLGIAFAMLIAKDKFSDSEKSALPGLLLYIAITELRYCSLTINSTFINGRIAVGCALSYLFGLTMQAPHGGLFVLFIK